MKKELKGYTVVFMKKEDSQLALSVAEGEGLMAALEQGKAFIHLQARNIMVRANTIDRIVGQYRALEEKCLYCSQPKPINSKCPRGCDEPNTKEENARSLIDEMRIHVGRPMPKHLSQDEVKEFKRCKACDVLIEKGNYCLEDAKIYE